MTTTMTLPPRPRPGHLQLAQHRLRRARPASSPWRSASSADLSAARLGRARPDARSGSSQLATAREALAQGRARTPATSRAHRHHQPARDHARLEPRDRRADPQRHRLAGPAHRAAVRRSCASAASSRCSASDRACVLDAYFSGTKLGWLLDHVPGARAQARARRAGLRHRRHLADLAAHRRRAVHAHRRRRNASRTLLFDVRTQRVGRRAAAGCSTSRASCCPRCMPSSARLRRHRRRRCSARRSRSAASPATSRARCSARPASRPGMAKNTYGTGCFMLMNTGDALRRSRPTACITTSAAQIGARAAVRARRQRLHRRRGRAVAARRPAARSRRSGEVQALAESVPDSGGVMFVPAFTGLGAPLLGPRRARHDRRPDARHARWRTSPAPRSRASPSRARRCSQAMSRDAVAAGGAPVSRAARRRRRLRQRPADAVPGRPARHSGGAAGGDRDHGARRGLPGGPGLRRLQAPTSSRRSGRSSGASCRRCDAERAAELMERWEHAVRQATLA